MSSASTAAATLEGPAGKKAPSQLAAEAITPACTLTAGAAKYLGVSVAWLKKARCEGTGPRYVKIGRAVVYRIADLDAFLDAHSVESEGR